jgi:hypothetical protein
MSPDLKKEFNHNNAKLQSLDERYVLLQRDWDNSRLPELNDFDSAPIFVFPSLRIGVDICADFGKHQQLAEKQVEFLPGGSAGISQADLYFIISNKKDLEDEKIHVRPGGFVLRTDGHDGPFQIAPSSMYRAAAVRQDYLTLEYTNRWVYGQQKWAHSCFSQKRTSGRLGKGREMGTLVRRKVFSKGFPQQIKRKCCK